MAKKKNEDFSSRTRSRWRSPLGELLGFYSQSGCLVVMLLLMVGLGSATDTLIRFGRWPVRILNLSSALAILYRYVREAGDHEMANHFG